MEVSEIAVDEIEVGERFRKDYQLDDDFLDTIKEKGIIQPITVSQDLKLVAGGRRLAGAKAVGLISVPVLMRQIEDELDLRECEYIENAFRKDLTWTERNANVARIHELVIEKFGEKRGNIRRVTELVNRSSGGVVRCLQMHKEVTQFPKLGMFKTEDEAVKILRKMREKMAAKLMVKQYDKRIEDMSGKGDQEVSELPQSVQNAMYAKSHFNIGDAFVGMQDMLDAKLTSPISFVEVDPPYGINLKEVKKGETDRKLDKYEEVETKEYPAFIEKVCRYLFEVTPKDTRLIFWFGIEWYRVIRNSLEEAGFKVDPIPCVWTKRAGQTNAPELYLARAWEPFFVAWKGEGIPIKERGRTNVFEFPVVPATRKYHPTQRPLELMREILRTFAWKGCIIMVPFLGSGATLRAAYLEGMNGFGWELNEENKEPFLANVESDIEDTMAEIKAED